MRLIDAELAKKDFRSNFGDVLDAVAAAEIIDRQPAVETILPTREQVEKLRGEVNKVDKFLYTCSKCGSFIDRGDDFCCRCGIPLTDKAIEIALRRLEALKGNG